MKPVEPILELPRLSEGGDPELMNALDALRAHGPDAAELASLTSRLALQGISVATPPSAAATAAWKKWLLAAGGAASGAALWLAAQETPAPPSAVRAPDRAAEVVTTEVATPTPGARPEPPVARSPRPVVSASPAPHDASSAPASPPVPVPVPVLVPVPAAATTAPREAAGPVAARRETAPGAHTPFSPSDADVGGTLLESTRDRPTEIELLRDARLALKASPAQALELTERHGREFPSGKLVQERELLAISALVSLGRRTAALSRASRFHQTFPESPYRKQIGELLR